LFVVEGATLFTVAGRSVFDLARTVWSEFERDYARYLAAAMVYYALVSLVPLILLLMSALGLLLRFSDVAALVEQDVLRSIETSFGAPIRATLQDLFDQLQSQSVVASVISLGGLLVAASKLFKQLRLSFRAIWNYTPPIVSGTIRVVVTATVIEQAVSFLMLLAGGALLLIALALVAVFQWLGAHLERLPQFDASVTWLLALPTPFIIVTLTFAMLFRFLPPVRVRWRHIWISAVVCATGWMIAAEALTLYGIFFADKFGAWGAIGGLLMIMLWMNIVSQVLFYGAELCKVMSSEEMTPDRSPSLAARGTGIRPIAFRATSNE
jgi:membrane protein